MPRYWLRFIQDGVNYLTIVDPAETPSSPVSPNVPLNTLLAMAIGLSSSVGAVYLLKYLDDTIRSPDEVRQLLGAPMLAAISELTTHEYNDQLVTQNEPRSPISESYRALRTKLQLESVDAPLKTMSVTSSSAGEG